MSTLAIIQARMSSTRLPGKVLQEINGKPMLWQVLERARQARSLNTVMIATTTETSDDPIAAFAASMSVPCYRGSLSDVLDRYYQAALPHTPSVIVRLTADCPLLDPALIDQTVTLLTSAPLRRTDFACNRLPSPFSRSFPIGLDVEACTFAALERAWKEADQPFQREHVMPYLYEGTTLHLQNPQLARGISPRGFGIAQLHHNPNYGTMRWTVDTPEDLAFVREIFARLGSHPSHHWQDVLQIVHQNPHLSHINASIHHKTMTDSG
jgi:spore coat polysaccharide biosynthesis protein SpsF